MRPVEDDVFNACFVAGLRKTSTSSWQTRCARSPRSSARLICIRCQQLADMLLPDEDPAKARPRLWQSAAEARRVLGEAFKRDRDGRSQLDRTRVTIDTDELDQALSLAGQAGDPASEAEHLDRALALFRGEPLAGTDYPWAEGGARHLRATYAHILERVGRARLATGDARGALEAAERGLGVDELNEGLWRLAMEAETGLGLREAVSHRYDQLRLMLGERLGLEPEKETRALYHQSLGQG
jgi:two-component SAPR family response regulator